jgi:TBC1 domain family member 24
MDCFFHEGIKVLYRVALAILILFHKHTQNSSEWNSDSIKNDIDNAIPKFCKQISKCDITPSKLMRTAFNIRALRYFFLV